MRRYVATYEVDDTAVKNAHSFMEWVMIFAEGDLEQAEILVEEWEGNWDCILEAVILEYVQSGDYSDYVQEVDGGFDEEVHL